MPDEVDVTTTPAKDDNRHGKVPKYTSESYLIEDLKRHIRELERDLDRERKSRQKAWDRATDAMEAEHFMRRLAEFMKKFND